MGKWKLRPEVENDLKPVKNLMTLADNHMIALLNVTLSELDFMAENMSDKEMEELVTNNLWETFSHKKKVLQTRNKYLNLYNESRK